MTDARGRGQVRVMLWAGTRRRLAVRVTEVCRRAATRAGGKRQLVVFVLGRVASAWLDADGRSVQSHGTSIDWDRPKIGRH